MNKRIRELAADAGYPDYMTYGQDKVLEKFAVLIVDQMLDITDAHTEVFQTDRDRAVIEHIKQSVKTHFGVEE